MLQRSITGIFPTIAWVRQTSSGGFGKHDRETIGVQLIGLGGMPFKISPSPMPP